MKKFLAVIGVVVFIVVWQVAVPAKPAPQPEMDTTAETTVVVARVIDGDTFDLASGERVRLIGVDAPERDRAGYAAATERLRELVEQQTVKLRADVSDVDRYDRLLRYVYVDDLFINEVLAREGLVDVKSYPPDTARQTVLRQAEQAAKRENKGIWK